MGLPLLREHRSVKMPMERSVSASIQQTKALSQRRVLQSLPGDSKTGRCMVLRPPVATAQFEQQGHQAL
jgi:hypothetical protein